jgi:small subunit ribosomal protein S20
LANSRSARKRIRSSERKRVRNRIVRSAVRTRISRVRRSLVSGQSTGIEEELRAAVKALDKAAEKGILHRNNAARRKSRIMTMAAKLTRMGGSEAEKAATRAAAAGGAKGRSAKVVPAAGAKATSAAKGAAAKKASTTKAAATTAKAPAAKPGTTAKPGTAAKPAGAAKRAGSTRRTSSDQ